MDILQPKYKSLLDKKLLNIINLIKFKNNNVELKGSSSLSSQKYFSDYDLFSNISIIPNVEDTYNEFKRIFEDLEKNDIKFIELKLQTVNNKKIRFKPNKPFTLNKFKKDYDNIDFIKLDIIPFINNTFIEVSIIYKFSKDKLTTSNYIEMLNDDIKELNKSKEYYKVLKRQFNIYKANKDYPKLLLLTDYFNSDVGKQYQIKSNLEAIKKIHSIYKDTMTNRKIEINLKDIKDDVNVNNINSKLKEYSKEINNNAKSFKI
jgi:hypothetical protein